MGLLLLSLSFCFLAPSPAMKTTIVQQNEAVEPTNQDNKGEERADDSVGNILFGSGVGLVAVGGIGAGVIAHNNNKPKNVPSKKSEKYYDENDLEK